MFSRQSTQGGYTLIEVIIVMVVIGVLSAIILVYLNESNQEARVRAAQIELKQLHTAMELLAEDTGVYPHGFDRYCPPFDASDNEINLSTPGAGLVSSNGSFGNWSGPYVRTAVDPWGNPFFFDEDYYCTAGAVGCDGFTSNNATEVWSVLVSCGPDGLIGDDPGNPQPNNGIGCAYNDDNVVYPLCRNE